MKTIKEASEYLRALGYKESIDFSIIESIEIIELNINTYYFCSVGGWDNDLYEVYELHHGAKISEDGKEYLTDGELWQYKIFKSLKRALDFALRCKDNQVLPSKPLKVW